MAQHYDEVDVDVDVDVDTDSLEPQEFEVPVKLYRHAGLRPPPPPEPLAGSAASLSAAARSARSSDPATAGDAPDDSHATAEHAVRTSSVAPVTMHSAERQPAARGHSEPIGTRSRLTAVHGAAVLSIALVGGVVAHAAWQPAWSGEVPAPLGAARPAAAARAMLAASGHAGGLNASSERGFSGSDGV